MNERTRLFGAGGDAGGAGGGPAGNLSAMQQHADQLLAAGDQAINQALSNDSEKFLTASRQQGGQ
jgi:hypothetical protein